MRRVVVTGLGIVSSIGNNKQEVLDSLKSGRSGISHNQEYADLGFRSHVSGEIKLDLDNILDRKLRRFMGDGAAFNYLAMQEAIEDAGLEESDVSNERTGIIMGSGGTSTKDMCAAYAIAKREGSASRVGPFMVPRIMSNTNSATLAVPFKIKRRQLFHHLGLRDQRPLHRQRGRAYPAWQAGHHVFAGGGEEVYWTAIHAVRCHAGPVRPSYNDRPDQAHRALST